MSIVPPLGHEVPLQSEIWQNERMKAFSRIKNLFANRSSDAGDFGQEMADGLNRARRNPENERHADQFLAALNKNAEEHTKKLEEFRR